MKRLGWLASLSLVIAIGCGRTEAPSSEDVRHAQSASDEIADADRAPDALQNEAEVAVRDLSEETVAGYPVKPTQSGPASPAEQAAGNTEYFQLYGKKDSLNTRDNAGPAFAGNPSGQPLVDGALASQPRYGEVAAEELSQFSMPPANFNTEAYSRIVDNVFQAVLNNPLSTFSIDVDTASYANTRRFLNESRLPPPDAVRIEEMVNYFKYDYAPPTNGDPFAVHTELTTCPWDKSHWLLRVGLKGREVETQRRPASNLVFLLDVSGSMESPDKLPLLRQGMSMLTKQLGGEDTVSIVVYAGSSGLVLPPTKGNEPEIIIDALNRLSAGGSTNGASGIQQAYDIASDNFIPHGVNRVILATDGDFNVGISDQGQLTRLIEEKAKSGVFLTVLGFGTGNLQDATMEQLADRGNGAYAYIDSEREAHKVLVEEMSGTLITIAKDVKIQIEFNPAKVSEYRLIGYENRVLAAEDFNDDKKDAGEIGAGHTVTALYELVPPGEPGSAGSVDPLKYQSPPDAVASAIVDDSDEFLTLKLRYKQPDGDTSKLIETVVATPPTKFAKASVDHRFAAAVASFGMVLRNSEFRGDATLASVEAIAKDALGDDEHQYRHEFVGLVRSADRFFVASAPR